MGKKLGGQAAGAAPAEPGLPGRLGLLVDEATTDQFLVDTGAVYSVIPHSSSEQQSGPRITTANGKPIPCWGWTERAIKAGGRVFRWHFLKAAVSFPILGADFLQGFDLLVDLTEMKLLTRSGKFLRLMAPPKGSVAATNGIRLAGPQSLNGLYTSTPSALQQHLYNFGSTTAALHFSTFSSTSTTTVEGQYRKLLNTFPAVLNPSKRLPEVKHSVEHFIETDGRPVSSKYRRLDASKLQAAKAEFQEMESQGIVRRSSSSWASPLHMVKKADGSWRPCGDFCQLNL